MRRPWRLPILLLLCVTWSIPAGAEGVAVTELAFWRDYPLDRPLEERIYPAPQALIDHVTADNIAGGFDERPRPADPDAAFLRDMRDAIAGLPESVKRLVGRRLIGVFPIVDLGGTAYAEIVRDGWGEAVAAFLAIDARIIDTPADAWATWRANTPFLPRTGHGVRVRIAPDGENDRRSAMQFILLHEFGHAAAVGTDIHPPWDRRFEGGAAAFGAYRFASLSWTVDEDGTYVSRWDRQFPQRAGVTFYKGPRHRIDIREAPSIYAALERTDFVSLYAATSPYEDFAETLASYVHVHMLGRPWEVDLVADGRVVATPTSCWDGGRCDAKRAFVETLLAAPDGERAE